MTQARSLAARRVLVDTSGYYALTDPRDINHASATAIARRLIAERWRLFTTNLILPETHALLLTRLRRATALRVVTEIDRSTITILRVRAHDEQRARAIITQYHDKTFSHTDATSFAVMERLGILHAFTFDRNFVQYGFMLLTPDLP